MSRKTKSPLSDLENRVMQIAWQRGEVTAEQVRTELAPEQRLKDSTIRTILRRLEQKGYVRHSIQGRTYIYSPTASSDVVAADAVRKIIDRFCEGSVENLLLGMVNREVVSPQKLTQLAERIAKSKREAQKQNQRRRGDK